MAMGSAADHELSLYKSLTLLVHNYIGYEVISKLGRNYSQHRLPLRNSRQPHPGHRTNHLQKSNSLHAPIPGDLHSFL